jgi:hypothetical protein
LWDELHKIQSWWRKIQKTVLSTEYKDNESSIEQWLKSFFGLAFWNDSAPLVVRFALSDGNEDHNVGGNLESRTM